MKRTLGIDPAQHSIGFSVWDPGLTPQNKTGRYVYIAQMPDAYKRQPIEEKFLAAREVICRLLDKFGIEQVAYEMAQFGYQEPKLYGLRWIVKIETLRRKIRGVFFNCGQWYSIAYRATDFEDLGRKRVMAAMSEEDKEVLRERAKCWQRRKGKVETRKLVAAELGISHKDIGGDAADAYFVGKVGQRFWAFNDGEIQHDDLSPDEKKVFYTKKTFTKGKNKGKTVEGGLLTMKGQNWFPPDFVQEVNIRLEPVVDEIGVGNEFS